MSHPFFITMFNFYHCTIYNFFATSKIKPDMAMKVQRLLNGMLHPFCVEIIEMFIIVIKIELLHFYCINFA